jgi:hypothetical protein
MMPRFVWWTFAALGCLDLWLNLRSPAIDRLQVAISVFLIVVSAYKLFGERAT